RIINRLTPRWGGSYETMEEFAEDSDQYLDKNPDLKILRGFIYIDRGDIVKRRAESNSKVISTVAKNAVPLLTSVIDSLATALEKPREYTDEEKENVRKAIELYGRALTFGENASFYEDRAYAYDILKNTSAQLADFKRAIELYPIDPNYYEGCARAYFDMGNYQESLKNAEMSDRLGFDPESLQQWRKWAAAKLIYSGYQSYMDKNYDEALRVINIAVLFKQDFPETYYWRGRVSTMQGREDLAIEDFEQAIKINPDYFDAYHNLGYLYGKGNQLQKSLEYFNKALEINPAHTKALLDRSYTYHLLGNEKKSEEDLKKSCDLGYEQACRIAGITKQ
ncbi:MAG: tetratricopeptide repeat protein, partial [Candidatus Omnitrophica bacterium]|nr:tetratricopeptide repeat protein [Candidatus Omnitrophota bacterium]